MASLRRRHPLLFIVKLARAAVEARTAETMKAVISPDNVQGINLGELSRSHA